MLSVGLVTLAAVAVTLAVARHRADDRRPEPLRDDGLDRPAPLLDSLRAAGL